MTGKPCRPWLTYRGNPRQYQPWCECGTWRDPGWMLSPAAAQKEIDWHLAYMAEKTNSREVAAV
jgi:hypothetical protein